MTLTLTTTPSEQKLSIPSTKIIFSHLNDPKFGSQITIDVTPDTLRSQITSWATTNSLKQPSFKQYTNQETNETTYQYTLKLSPYLLYLDAEDNQIPLDQLNYSHLARNSRIALIAYAYEYHNNFGDGITASVSAIKLLEKAPKQPSRKDNDLAELKSL